MLQKLLYLFKTGYNPYFLYWLDLLTERKLKYRIGECIDCVNCCKSGEEYCPFVDIKTKTCVTYNRRQCDQWFPISKKELEFMERIKPGLNCKFKFIK